MKLLGRTGKVAGQTIPIPDLLRIGAAADNDFRVSLAGISRHHARVIKEGEAFWLEDAGSTNGTFLNGQRVVRERLRHLDVITLGRDVDLISVDSTGDTGAHPLPRAVEDAWLEPVDARDVGRVDVPLGEITIGRLAPSNVILDSPVVSHLHARIRRTADHVFVQDLDSANGTFVNGAPIREITPLSNGDTLAIAGSRHFRVHVVGTGRRGKSADQSGSQSQSIVFDPAWQTRLVWSADELGQLEEERRRILESVKKEPGLAGVAAAKPVAPVPAVKPAAPAPAAAAAKPVAAPAPAAAKPAAPAAPVAAPAVKAAAPVAPVAAPKPAPAAPPPSPAPVAPAAAAAPVTKPAAPAPVAAVPKPAPPPKASTSENDALTIAGSPFAAPVIPSAKPLRAVTLTGSKGTFTIETGRHTIGRSETAGVSILDPQVSRTHAIVLVSGTEARIEDGGSSNGTFVNDVRVPAGGVALKSGDRLSFGSVEFTVELVS